MKKVLLASVVVLSLVGLAAEAQAGVFFGARVGGEKYKIDNSDQSLEEGRTDVMFDAFVGYHARFFRIEAEYGYHPERSFQGGLTKTETQTIMGNVYFSPPIRSMIQPYVMGGAGVALHDIKVNPDSDNNTSFAWQIGAGLELEFTERVFLDVGGRWLDMGQAELQTQKYDIKGLSYYAGIRFEY